MQGIAPGEKNETCLSRKSLLPVIRRTAFACSVLSSLIRNIPYIVNCPLLQRKAYCSTAHHSFCDIYPDTCTLPYHHKYGGMLSLLPCDRRRVLPFVHSYIYNSIVCCPWLSCKPPQTWYFVESAVEYPPPKTHICLSLHERFYFIHTLSISLVYLHRVLYPPQKCKGQYLLEILPLRSEKENRVLI